MVDAGCYVARCAMANLVCSCAEPAGCTNARRRSGLKRAGRVETAVSAPMAALALLVNRTNQAGWITSFLLLQFPENRHAHARRYFLSTTHEQDQAAYYYPLPTK